MGFGDTSPFDSHPTASTLRTPRVVLFCCNSAFGMANFRAGVIRALIEAGDRVVVVAPRDQYVDALQVLGAQYIEWKLLGRGTSVFSEMAALRRLRAIYQAVRPSIAYHFTIKPVIYGALAARSLRIPFVSVVTGLGYAFINANWIGKVAIALYRITLRWSREVWLLNVDDRDAMERQGLLKMVTVRMLPGEGIDTARFQPQPPSEAPRLRFLMVSRLLRDKGVIEFVEAARRLHSQGVNAQFILLGAVDADNPTAITSDEVDSWQAEGIVTYLGVTRDVRQPIAEADCIVLPSYREGLPRSLLEASAMEKPIIATDVPGCREVVVDGETGYLCRVKDADDLAAKMHRLLELPRAERERMGRCGRQFVVDRFDEQLVLRHYWDSLRALCRLDA